MNLKKLVLKIARYYFNDGFARVYNEIFMILFTIELDALLPKKVALHFLHVFFYDFLCFNPQ